MQEILTIEQEKPNLERLNFVPQIFIHFPPPESSMALQYAYNRPMLCDIPNFVQYASIK